MSETERIRQNERAMPVTIATVGLKLGPDEPVHRDAPTRTPWMTAPGKRFGLGACWSGVRRFDWLASSAGCLKTGAAVQPFKWTAKADTILEKNVRVRQVLAQGNNLMTQNS
jgi:hypothetical protein